MEIILTHINADFDALASLIGAHRLYPDAVPILPRRLNRNVEQFLILYGRHFEFTRWENARNLSPARIILTDTQTIAAPMSLPKRLPTLIIEHHQRERKLEAHETWRGEEVGAITTYIVEQMHERHLTPTPFEATLFALGIYEDTGSLTYGGTTPRDAQAVAWLLSQGAMLDIVRRHLSYPLDEDQRLLLQSLLSAAQSQSIEGHQIIIATAQADHYQPGMNSITSHMSEILEPDALITLVQFPDQIQMVARSRVDEVDVGELARGLAGGGHSRASAATIRSHNLAEAQQQVQALLSGVVQPATRIADLMSWGVQTVSPEEKVTDVIARLRRIGHEGYPVVASGRVCGLLQLQDANRVAEHQLADMIVQSIMRPGEVFLTPQHSVGDLEKLMIASGWGQIPVVDENKAVIGIVTRTDLINYWAQQHQAVTQPQQQLAKARITEVLGPNTAELIERIASFAQEKRLALYLVGGCVRDILLGRANLDIDFVLEEDAIRFADLWCAQHGGRIHAYPPFGTATWYLPESSQPDLPDHIDFATARSEIYNQPAVLPTTYRSGIKLDLRRRDFTINTLAVQLSPPGQMGDILDFYGGLSDMSQRLIRVLHSVSFIDDPTRIVRAVRFSERLQFTIEPHTASLITAALPMLSRITGERIRNEFTALLNEAIPIRGLRKLAALGVLAAIHPDWDMSRDVEQRLEQAQKMLSTPSEKHVIALPASLDRVLCLWGAWFAEQKKDTLTYLLERLMFGKKARDLLLQSNILQRAGGPLSEPGARPSAICAQLEALDPEVSYLVYIVTLDPIIRQHLAQYLSRWRTLKPTISGHDLRDRGVPEGPVYRRILQQLRNAWLDGEIETEETEEALLERLLNHANFDE